MRIFSAWISEGKVGNLSNLPDKWIANKGSHEIGDYVVELNDH